jgi:hypothetical protein
MIRAARLFLADATRPAIIAAMHQREPNGVRSEQESPEVLADWHNEQELAAGVRRAIERFSFDKREFRSHKMTDWPAFRASKFRTMSAFESAYNSIWIKALNEAELFYDASIEPRGEDDISLHVLLNRYQNDAEMGRKLLRLYNACREWRHIPFQTTA